MVMRYRISIGKTGLGLESITRYLPSRVKGLSCVEVVLTKDKTSFLTATALMAAGLISAHGAGITMAAGTILTLK